jgi:phosphoribosylamine--glycine ligase
VVKADGLAAGKGVIVCRSLDDADRALALCFEERAFGVSGLTVVVEEFLEGEEASFFAIADGAAVLPLAAAQDHKTVFDEDRGPNTGGMGAYSPAPVMTDAMQDRVMAEIVRPVIAAMGKEGAPYGVLFVSLMITREGRRSSSSTAPSATRSARRSCRASRATCSRSSTPSPPDRGCRPRSRGARRPPSAW